MSGLAKFLEDEGLATAVIALVRHQAEEVRPPRALWVPFALGRPFGAAGDAPFQRRVLMALLDLFARPVGPVLEDFTCDAPPDGEDRNTLEHMAVDRDGSLIEEVDDLRPWHEASVARRGRTTVGASGLDAPGAARLLVSWLDGKTGSADVGLDMLRLASEDLKTYYMESAAAHSSAIDTAAVMSWFWARTAAGRVIRDVRAACLLSDNETLRDGGAYMFVPEGVND